MRLSEYLSSTEAAELLGIHRVTLIKLENEVDSNGKPLIVPHRFGKRRDRRYKREELYELMEKLKVRNGEKSVVE